ncbi:cyclin-dependent kinase 2-interacting protein-like isoform X1 [Lasioglossum baleicum]|uniref:cyclin-dependent kinase 2-interacting protein-like isoform X1 n=1 Tax=Lasioglossum baleicum TaxID=434251 RepID=UPI003FCCD92D
MHSHGQSRSTFVCSACAAEATARTVRQRGGTCAGGEASSRPRFWSGITAASLCQLLLAAGCCPLHDCRLQPWLSGNPEMMKEQFSPVSKIQSVKPMQGKNLVGSARHIRDLAADVHASIQEWNAAHLQGVELLKDITQEKQSTSYSQHLQELCDKLEHVCDALDDVVSNLTQIAYQIKSTTSLGKDADKLFTTWPTTKFDHVAKLILSVYSEEAKIKRKIFENVAHRYTESWKMLCLATWVHQPLLPESLTIFLESLLIETGHR